TGLSDPRLARALVAMHEEPARPWSLEAMAKEAGMSRSAFAARFRSVVGETPADYLSDWRLTIAQSQLRAGRSLKTIAGDLGYSNPSALSRLFARRVGASARSWLAASAGSEEAGDGA